MASKPRPDGTKTDRTDYQLPIACEVAGVLHPAGAVVSLRPHQIQMIESAAKAASAPIPHQEG